MLTCRGRVQSIWFHFSPFDRRQGCWFPQSCMVELVGVNVGAVGEGGGGGGELYGLS